MASATSHLVVSLTAAAVLAGAAARAHAQAAESLPAVTVTGQTPPVASVGGWGQVALESLPQQATLVDAERMRDAGVRRLSDVARLDASAGDAYNAEGYWDSLTVRGFVIDQRFNYRRDGLPINAETSLPLDNKERIELLHGISGLQAGTSAPGGLVNLVVKRPTARPLRSVEVGWREPGTWLGALDLSQRFGPDEAAALRLNAAYERIDPHARSAQGRRHLLAAAGEWRATRGTLLEAEFETSRRSQPSVPGFSLLGDQVPDAKRINPRINLNNQPWTRPVVLEGDTGSLRLTQELTERWHLMAHLARQQLRSDDRIAFPFGKFDPATFDCDPCDRFASDGTFTLWEFASDNERRRSDAAELTLAGRVATGPLEHQVTAGLLRSRYRARFEQQLFDIAGVGNIDGTAVVPRSSGFLDENTNRNENSTEWHLRDAVALGPVAQAWLGLRHTRIERRSVRTDGSRPIDFTQSFTTPWAALSRDIGAGTLAYASWGRGVESEVVPNRARYTNAGEALPSLKSRQVEVGLKQSGRSSQWSLAAFEIERPAFEDFGSNCDSDAPGATCTRQVDGSAQHRGITASAALHAGPWTLDGGIQLLHARRRGSADPTLNGLRPTNVPQRTLKLQSAYDVAAAPGLALQTALVYEGPRMVLPDNSARIPGYTRVDAAARYVQGVGPGRMTWRLGVDNLFDRRAWKEAPFQFEHAYLFPLAPRTWHASLHTQF